MYFTNIYDLLQSDRRYDDSGPDETTFFPSLISFPQHLNSYFIRQIDQKLVVYFLFKIQAHLEIKTTKVELFFSYKPQSILCPGNRFEHWKITKGKSWLLSVCIWSSRYAVILPLKNMSLYFKSICYETQGKYLASFAEHILFKL